MLSRTQIDGYRRDGFVVVENAFSADQVDAIRSAALGIVEDFDADRHRTVFTTTDGDAGRDDYFFDSARAVHCFLEAGAVDDDGRLNRDKHLAINKIGHAMHDQVPAFTRFCRLPVIGQALRDLGHRDPVLWQTMYIFKQPGIGGEVRWHQDASYLMTQPPAVTGIWIAVEDATRDNGCLWMQPGGHRTPLREIYEVNWRTREGTLRRLNSAPWPDADSGVALEVPAGTAVFFHDHMPHCSSQNSSDRSRHAFTLHASDLDARWATRNWLQRGDLPPFLL